MTSQTLQFKEINEFGNEGDFIYDRGALCLEGIPAIALIDPDQCNIFSKNLTKIKRVEVPPTGYITLNDAFITGFRTIIKENFFAPDEIFGTDVRRNAYLNRIGNINVVPCYNEDTLIEKHGDSFRFNELFNKRLPPLEIKDHIIFIGSNEPSNWGSFIYKVLPKLVTIQKHDIKYDRIMVYTNHKNQTLLLNFLGIPNEKILIHNFRKYYSFKNLTCVTPRCYACFLDADTLDFYRKISQRLSKVMPWRKIYISRLSRHATGMRPMKNESELIEALKKLGFEIIDPILLEPQEQIRVFAEAAIIVTPSGAGLFNTVFCKKYTIVIDIESEAHWICCHTSIFASMELRYHIFVGKVDPDDTKRAHKTWSVNLNALIEYVRHVLSYSCIS